MVPLEAGVDRLRSPRSAQTLYKGPVLASEAVVPGPVRLAQPLRNRTSRALGLEAKERIRW